MAMNGWQTLGAALGNNPNQSFNTGVTQGIQQGNLLEQARATRNKQLALAAMTPDVMQRAQSGDPAAQGIVAAAMAQSGTNYQEQAGGAKTEQNIGWGNNAMALATGADPDQNKINNILAVMHGEPQKLTEVSGGVALNPSMTPDSQNIAPTAVGSADIAKAMADANEANAGAGKNAAEAKRAMAGIGTDKAANWEVTSDGSGNQIRVNKLTGEVAPLSLNGQPVTHLSGAGNTRAPTANDLAMIGATDPVTGKPDPLKAQAFMAWQAQQKAIDPKMSNTDYALQKFSALHRSAIGTPGAPPPQNANPITGIQVPASNPIAGAMGGAPAPAAPTGIAAAMGGAPTALPPGVSPQGDYTPPAAGPAVLPAGLPPPIKAPGSPYPEGTPLKKGNQKYIVKNGIPVPVS